MADFSIGPCILRALSHYLRALVIAANFEAFGQWQTSVFILVDFDPGRPVERRVERIDEILQLFDLFPVFLRVGPDGGLHGRKNGTK